MHVVRLNRGEEQVPGGGGRVVVREMSPEIVRQIRIAAARSPGLEAPDAKAAVQSVEVGYHQQVRPRGLAYKARAAEDLL
mmetsp:Transcript_117356/g.250781  ORF Transcript_117356/g.250781 Transcript_117356/m.250781 type:complete len:80 (-) Transcript_117356:336-575(-)